MDEIKTFITLSLSVIIEAFPFLVLGSIIAILLERYNTLNKVLSKLPNTPFARRPFFALLGFIMPVCECGNVPVVRSMMRKGSNIGEATTFLLAAPILNPITLFTTMEAFRGIPWVTTSRMVGGFVIAIIVGIVVGRLKRPLTDSFAKSCSLPEKNQDTFSVKFIKTMWPLTKLLVVGAMIAAIVQIVVSQNLLQNLSQNYLNGVLIMLLFSFVIAICSNVDAFFALSFVGAVRLGAITSFLIAGPMVDIKMILMLQSTYSKKTLFLISSMVAVFAGLIGYALSYVG